jgi:phosphotransferase system HPr (HPr) family protein
VHASFNPTNSSSSRGPLSEVQVALPEAVALHARPAANFVKTAMRFRSRVTVGVNGRVADAKSILAVLALGATGGTLLRLNAEGDDAPAALDALAACVSGLVE